MLDLAAVTDELWRSGVGPDDRVRLDPLLRELAAPGTIAAQANEAIDAARARVPVDAPPQQPLEIANDTPLSRTELALFHALIELMLGTAVAIPALRDGPPASRVLATSAETWAAALARDPERLDHALGALERHLGLLAADDPRTPIARAWADLALGEAALAAADRTSARQRLEAVSRGAAPAPLRIAATLRIVTLLLERTDIEQARTRCRQAVSIASTANRPIQAQHARITGALLDFIAGDRKAARKTLETEAAGGGPMGLLPRIVLSSFEPPERAMPLLAEGLREAGERGDPFAFTICTLVGARRYAAIGRDADALLTLTTGVVQLRDAAPSFAAALDEERIALRTEWGADRFTAAEQAAIAILDAR